MGVTLDEGASCQFAGMVYPSDAPVTVPSEYVQEVTADRVPVVLREHADAVLGSHSGDAWWELGEFRYEGDEYQMAYGLWTRTGIRYGVDLSL